MKMIKIKTLGLISFALIGGGAIVSVPLIMTSCSKTSLSKVKFENDLGNVSFDGIEAQSDALDFLYGKFLEKNNNFNSEGIDYSFQGDVFAANSLSLTLIATKNSKYKGRVTIDLIANYQHATATKLSVTGYKSTQIEIHQGSKIGNRPRAWTWEQPKPTVALAPVGSTIYIKLSGQQPNVTNFVPYTTNDNKLDGGFLIAEARNFSNPAQGSFCFLFTAIDNTSGTLVAFNLVVINWTHL